MNLKATRKWCAAAHRARGQRYGQYAYSFHLRMVEAVALRFGFRDSTLRKCAWGHDLIEDLGLAREDLLAAGFGQEEVKIIWAVSDEPGATRKERKAKTYPKIRDTERAILVKLFDRIANVEYSIKTNNREQLEKYRKEQVDFERVCRNRDYLEAEPLWEHLNKLFQDNA